MCPVKQGDRAGVGRLAGKACLLDQVCGDAAVDDTQHLSHDGRTAREQETQRMRSTQHPLAYRLLGKHRVRQQRGALDHAQRG